MAQICGPLDGFELLRSWGVKTENVRKAVITIEFDSIVTVVCEHFAEWDKNDYKKLVQTYAVTLLKEERVPATEMEALMAKSREMNG
jgi:hypothetical protein